MTANQINYARHREDVRHNLSSEIIEGRKAGAAESQARTAALGQAEAARHNRESESINWFQSRESARHNLASESVAQRQLEEQSRHNLVGEQISSSQLAESIRHNMVGEQELSRHNVALEGVQVGQLEESRRHNVRSEGQRDTELAQLKDYQKRMSSASLMQARASQSQANAANINAQANRLNAETRVSELAESIRHSQAVESETNRHNSVLETQGMVQTLSGVHNTINQGLQAQAAWKQAKAAQTKAENDTSRVGIESSRAKDYHTEVVAGAFRDYATGVNSVLNTVKNLRK